MKDTFKKLVGLLDQADRRACFLFVIISFFGGAIEVAGVGSVMPFIGVLMNPDLVTTNNILKAVYDGLAFSSTKQFIVFMGCITLGTIILGGVVNILAVRLQLNLSYRIGHKWASRLFSTYLGQPYKFYLGINSNTMKSGILSEVDRAVASVLVPTSTLISKSMVLSVIFLMLLFVNPVITTILMVVIGSIYGALMLYFRHKMRRRGKEMVEHNKTRYQIVNEAFTGIREIKLYHNAGYFQKIYREASEEYNMAQAYSLFFGQVPRFIIEITGFATLISLALYMVTIGGNTAAHTVPLIAFFAAAGYKILPAAQNLYASLNSIRFYSASLATVADGMALSPETKMESSNAEKEVLTFVRDIEVKKLSFSYENQAAPALKDVDCKIKKNTLVTIMGPTGAGKSTFIDLLSGLLEPSNGEILIDSKLLTTENAEAWQRQIGYVPQKIHLLDGSIEENIAFGQPKTMIDESMVASAAKKAQIDEYIGTLPGQYHSEVGEGGDRLSGGQRQRVGIARALYRDPAVLILDEPTSALDGDTALSLLKTLKALAQEKTVIMITHATEAQKYSDQILIVSDGHIQDLTS